MRCQGPWMPLAHILPFLSIPTTDMPSSDSTSLSFLNPQPAMLPHISAFYNTYDKSSSILIVSPHDLKPLAYPQSKNGTLTHQAQNLSCPKLLNHPYLPVASGVKLLFPYFSTQLPFNLFPTRSEIPKLLPSSLPKSSLIPHGHLMLLYKGPNESCPNTY